MRTYVGMSLLAFVLAACSENTPAEPELPAKAVGAPPDWQTGIGASALYEIGLDRVEKHAGRSAVYMSGPALFTTDVAFLSQLVRPESYRGKRLRLSAWVKGRELVGPIAGIWMRVDGANVVAAYDNMGNRPESGTTGWHEVSVVLDVPNNALGILIGAMRQGGGTLFIDDMKLEAVENDVPSTNLLDAPLANGIDSTRTIANYLNASASPLNMSFEKTP